MAVKTFTTGEVLTAADTNTYLANAGLVYVTKATLSGTSTQINNCFTSTYAAYRLVFTSLTFSQIDVMTVRLAASGSTNTTANYYSTNIEVSQAGVFTGSSVIAQSYWVPSLVGVTRAGGGAIEIHNPQTSVATSFTAEGVDTRTTGQLFRRGSGFFDGTTSFDGIWISTLNGGYTLGGTVTVYGYRLG